jgi:serine/threonine protein kinase
MGSGGSAQKKQPFNQLYTITKELGTGAFSTVKLATKKATGEVFAVKIVNKKNLTPKDVDSLLTEIEILGKLDHPHIIKLYESIEEGHEYYIVTELVNGGELFDRIVSKTHYTELEARNLVKSLLETVAYMHDSGVVHRDLKPENLLLMSETNDTNVKICDFGFAKLISGKLLRLKYFIFLGLFFLFRSLNYHLIASISPYVPIIILIFFSNYRFY